MHLLVEHQGSQVSEGSPTLAAWIRPVFRVDFAVIIQGGPVSKPFPTLSAHERFLPSMQPLMSLDA
jgi:hypothetical protein